MGTFHDDKSPLHGITLVVEMVSGDAAVGRCEDEDEREVILLDADVHPSDDATDRAAYLERADRFGFWPRHPRVVIPRSEVERMYPLAQFDSQSVG